MGLAFAKPVRMVYNCYRTAGITLFVGHQIYLPMGSETKPPARWMQVALLVVLLQDFGYNGRSEGDRMPLQIVITASFWLLKLKGVVIGQNQRWTD